MNPSKLILEMYPNDPSSMARKNDETTKPGMSEITGSNHKVPVIGKSN